MENHIDLGLSGNEPDVKTTENLDDNDDGLYEKAKDYEDGNIIILAEKTLDEGSTVKHYNDKPENSFGEHPKHDEKELEDYEINNDL